MLCLRQIRLYFSSIVACVALTVAPAAMAQDVEAIVQALQPSARPAKPAVKRPLTRSFVINQPTRGISVEPTAPPESEAAGARPTIDLYVPFEYDQSSLSMSDAKITIDTLGKALSDPRLATMRFLIIGHTDGRGGDDYNLQLSQRRADAVRARLIDFHRVAAERLVAEGRGRRELKDPSRPEDGINRRVQIITIIDELS